MGFRVPDSYFKQLDIVDESAGTDSNLALRIRKGTGFYKVPSLKGRWYRGLFGHDRSCATLEDWFDPARLDTDYVPTISIFAGAVFERSGVVDLFQFRLGLRR